MLVVPVEARGYITQNDFSELSTGHICMPVQPELPTDPLQLSGDAQGAEASIGPQVPGVSNEGGSQPDHF